MRTERYIHILTIATEAVVANRFRSMLTALGIIFGVAAVIAMLAIGSGAQQEILDQIKLVGVNNIVITPINSLESGSTDEEGQDERMKQKFSPGLTLKDARSIQSIIPTVNKVSPEVVYETYILKDGKQRQAKLTGVTSDFFDIYSLTLSKGTRFNEHHMEEASPVCIIGPSIKSRFFPKEDPINKYIKCGSIWMKVIGILENRIVSEGTSENLGISDYNNTIYAPLQTVLLRYRDRSVVSASSLQSGTFFMDNAVISFSGGGSTSGGENQLDKIVVQVKESSQLIPTTRILEKMLLRRHTGVSDFEIRVPELLLKQQQRTKDIFNIVLGAIASISLIVGGIGIMNIMLASVIERTKEIGIRMATGATRRDIILQFLTEAIMISVTGGLIGIILGIVMAKIIMQLTDILTIVSPASIFISFGVSAAVGILFGYMPARKAASQNPVESLRYE
ncbi:MAG TPA: ABC transporter permease [Bacteroidales bacterium]|nr:ABC transporter permease [Bacteroidales bacterium]